MSPPNNLQSNNEAYLLDIFGDIRARLEHTLRTQGKTVDPSNPSAPKMLGFHLLQGTDQKLNKLAGIVKHQAKNFLTQVSPEKTSESKVLLTNR